MELKGAAEWLPLSCVCADFLMILKVAPQFLLRHLYKSHKDIFMS